MNGRIRSKNRERKNDNKTGIWHVLGRRTKERKGNRRKQKMMRLRRRKREAIKCRRIFRRYEERKRINE